MSNKGRKLVAIPLGVVVAAALILWWWDGFVGNTSCIIYGKVVNSSGAPIAGVQVKATLWRAKWNAIPIAFAARECFHLVATTAADGRFTLRGHGESLSINSFEAVGWYLPDTDRWPVETGGEFLRGEMPLRRGWSAAPDSDKPYVYVLFPESDESGRSQEWKDERKQQGETRARIEKMQHETEVWQANRAQH